jgi:NAD(P)-dependent dehydrogenase (short-subunit alcohol dehydrogenase family)
MLVDLTDAELRRAHATLKSENVSYVAADVSKADDTQRYIDKTVATFGKIDAACGG